MIYYIRVALTGTDELCSHFSWHFIYNHDVRRTTLQLHDACIYGHLGRCGYMPYQRCDIKCVIYFQCTLLDQLRTHCIQIGPNCLVLSSSFVIPTRSIVNIVINIAICVHCASAPPQRDHTRIPTTNAHVSTHVATDLERTSTPRSVHVHSWMQ